jgi:glycosyltransferase involved in cell wall biosynthesis
MNIFPPIVTTTTGLSGKELAYSLNFPSKSVSGLPVLECASFGRNISTYDSAKNSGEELYLGKIFHMNHEETLPVNLDSNSLTSHVFITGSTGSGKSNTVYQILSEAKNAGISARLTVIPGLPPDSLELLQALKTAYCFILPSRHEPFGIAALEALDAGVPLIAARVGWLRDFLIDGSNALLFDDNYTAGLLEAYRKIEILREKLISGGTATAAEYNWQSISAKLTNIYRGLLK